MGGLISGAAAEIDTAAMSHAETSLLPPATHLVELDFAPEAVEIVADAMPYFRPYSPITLLYHSLESLHFATGLPWWAVVAGATVSARLLMMPVVIYTMKNGAKMAQMKPEMDAIQARFKSEQRTDPGNSPTVWVV